MMETMEREAAQDFSKFQQPASQHSDDGGQRVINTRKS